MTAERRSWSADDIKSAREEIYRLRDEFAGIAGEVRDLLRLEAALARAELEEARGYAVRAAGFGAGAAVIGFIAAVLFFLTVMFALDTAFHLWLAALITTAIAGMLALILAVVARSQVQRVSPAPRRFAQTIREDREWLKSRLNSKAR